MGKLKLKDILEVTKGELILGDANYVCENFSKDTRTIQKGDTYIAIKGEKFDGNLFWKQALEKGADCVIVSDISYQPEELEKLENKIILKVDDTLQALYKIAKLKRSLYQIPVVAITGSVGKTSTKDMVANVLAQKYKTLKTIRK
jgi:UDP-N-acetylmuramoyl-tripeptide--D-alanyl-D-alanine ligase